MRRTGDAAEEGLGQLAEPLVAVEEAQGDGVHGDAVRRLLQGQAPGEGGAGALAGPVERGPDGHPQVGPAGDADDAAPGPLPHGRQHRPGQVHGPVGVDPEERFHVGRVLVAERGQAHPLGRDAGVVDQHVDRTQSRGGLGHRVGAGVAVTDVEGHREGCAAELGDLRRHPLGPLRVQVVDRHRRAVLGQAASDGSADVLARPRDEGDPPAQVEVHVGSPALDRPHHGPGAGGGPARLSGWGRGRPCRRQPPARRRADRPRGPRSAPCGG